ncbi:T9SS type A sorting domain-containing protein [Epilithonimonas vandammei]|uniref:T9SS type A sorting domain-containing protein n=1 Tax=Epilithonimonas vandammei TaxID=2487072 RepID=UPI0028B1E6E6|nr:T9SS type A sorting domain-containing protein [Epilithonimonas vandammei]
MRKQLFILASILSCLFSFAQIVNIPDANFKAYLVGNPAINTNGDNEIQVSEASAFTGEINVSNKGISLLWGIEYFTEITGLNCSLNSIQQLDLSNNKKLITLNCSGITLDQYGNNEYPNGQIETLNLTQNTNLKTLICSGNRLTSLDISKNTELEYLNCRYNRSQYIYENNEWVETFMTGLDTSKNTKLKHLDIGINRITEVDVLNNTELEFLSCEFNRISVLDVSNNINLITLNCGWNNISYLDISKNINLEKLVCANNNLTTIDINLNYDPKPKLKYLDCSYNKLSSIYLDDINSELEYLNCTSNVITSININYRRVSNLQTLFCSDNKLTDLNTMNAVVLKKLNCSFNQLESLIIHWNNIEWVYCNDNQLEWFIDRYNNYPTLTRFVGHNNKFKSLDFSYSPNVSLINVENNQLTSLNVKNGNNINFLGDGYAPLDTRNNPNLKCVNVDDANYSNTNWIWKDSQTIYSTDCSSTLATNQTQKSQTKIFPNPVKNILNIQTEAKLQKVEIYSSNGQLIKTSFLKQINVSTLPKGNYIVKITTDKGVQTEKFIKE